VRRLAILAAIAVGTFGLLGGPAGGTTVRSLSMSELLAGAGLVFEGRVLASEVRAGPSSTSIRTCARFEVLEVLKGVPPPGPLELCFAGGTAGGVTLVVDEVRHPEPGEVGLYFVESPGARQIHPLHGWAQGHFRYAPLVATADGDAVLGLEPTLEATDPGVSAGVARGLLTAPAGSRAAREALSPEAFKALLRARLAGSPP